MYLFILINFKIFQEEVQIDLDSVSVIGHSLGGASALRIG